VVLSPGPVATIGLATLEAMACGTPVVVNEQSALPEVVGDGGVAVPGTADAFADAVSRLLERPRVERRAAARAQAEQYGWPKSVEGFLRAHEAIPERATVPATGLIRPAVPSRDYLNGVPAPRRISAAGHESGADEAGAARYA
jgi:alpha-1,6-mannosyltransferase